MLLSVSNHNKPHLAAGRARTRRGVQVQVTEPWRRAPPQRCRHCDQRHQSPTHPVAKRPGGRGTDLRQNDNPSPKSERRCWVSLGGLVTSIHVLAKHGFVFFFQIFRLKCVHVDIAAESFPYLDIVGVGYIFVSVLGIPHQYETFRLLVPCGRNRREAPNSKTTFWSLAI